MKKLVIAAAIVAASAAAVQAGSMAEPMMEAPVVVEAAESASAGSNWIIPLILLALIVASGL